MHRSPDAPKSDPLPGKRTQRRTNALVTPSYRGDFERFRILCETVDRHVSGLTRHYVLVEPGDMALFRTLETPHRTIIDERDILPRTLLRLPDPKTLGRRLIWLGFGMKPLYGWHVQQLRSIAIAHHLPEDGFVYIGSDSAFVRDCDLASYWSPDDRVALYRRDHALGQEGATVGGLGHDGWSRTAMRLLGPSTTAANQHDYITTAVAWRAETVRALCAHIEAETGLNWMRAIGRERAFSERILYGRFVDDILGGQGHFITDRPRAKVFWFDPELGEEALAAAVRDLAPDQVAVCIQSFIDIDIATRRRIFGLD